MMKSVHKCQYVQFNLLQRFSTSSVKPEKKSMLSSFFGGLQKMGVGKQFELEKEKLLWGNAKSSSSNIGSIIAEANKQKVANEKNLISEWKIFNDREYGGKSHCEVVVNTKSSTVSFSGCVVEDVKVVDKAGNKVQQGPGTSVSAASANAVSAPSGYCALTGYCENEVDLINFEGVELMVRTSKPISFLFSLKPVSLIADDLYQVIVQTSNSSWKRFHLPFHKFSLTARGQLAMEQRVLDNLKLKHVGILITMPNEPFKIEIQSVKAITHMDDDVIKRTVRDKVEFTDEEMDQLYPMDDLRNVFTKTSQSESEPSSPPPTDKTK